MQGGSATTSEHCSATSLWPTWRGSQPESEPGSVERLPFTPGALQFLDGPVDTSPNHCSGRIALLEERSDAPSGPERGALAVQIDQIFRRSPDVGIEFHQPDNRLRRPCRPGCQES